MLASEKEGSRSSDQKQNNEIDGHAESSSWLERRKILVEQALRDGDYETLQRIAALPGGFGTEELRKEVW